MTWLGRAVRLIPVVILFVLATSCDNFFVSESSIQSVTVTPTAILLEAGATPADTYQLVSTATTVGGTQTTDTPTAAWKSSGTSVATVGTAATAGTVPGLVTAAGSTGNVTATITATDGAQSGSANVLTYTGTAPTSIAIDLPSGLVPSSIAPGQTFQLTAAADINSNSAFNITNFVSWASSDTTVATVNASGFVTVRSTATVGTTFTVTATANFGKAATTATVTGTSSTFTII